ncbi:hypothetical protein [Actinoplanes subtropicus]|uniref:hypothetical protein n=1 Tax=Actinoplanes subtropicus TaxID=543632 RepID=UPI0004C41EB2|nr:hypothetical protein [Actinoplanes subtropicus]
MSSWADGSTRRWRATRAAVLARDGYLCRAHADGWCDRSGAAPHQCTGRADLTGPHAGHAHHVYGRAVTGDDPQFVVSACRSCNLAIGEPEFPQSDPADTRRRVLFSLPEGDQVVTPRAELAWDPVRLAEYAWLRPFLEVPDDAAPPLAMSLPAEDAVGSYGADAVGWIESELGIRLRWWQRLAITRQLEHRADGSLSWRSVVESCPRRAGKSVRVRGLALWRMAHADQIGEVQTVVHCGSDLPICREIQRGAWRWAEAREWTVSRSNGKEALEAPDGSRWLVRSQDGVYGYDVGLGVVDEAWDVKPDTVSEGLEPAMLERLWAQLHLTSTAHRRATSLMKQRIRDALTIDDGETLLMLWAAGVGAVADPGDPAVWRAASPYWSEDRRRMIAAKYAAALAGEADPQADDPDPMQGFLAQYLNVWQLRPSAVERGDAAVSPDDWSALVAVVPDRAPDAAAVESWFGDGVSVALVWRTGGQVVVSVRPVAGLSEVPAVLAAAGFRRTATVGASLAEDPALAGVRVRKGQGRTGAAVQELRRLLAEDVVRHSGGEYLTGQVLSARTMPGADGPRMVSSGAAEAIKAAVWAISDCRRPQVGKPRIVVARRAAEES